MQMAWQWLSQFTTERERSKGKDTIGLNQFWKKILIFKYAPVFSPDIFLKHCMNYEGWISEKEENGLQSTAENHTPNQTF